MRELAKPAEASVQEVAGLLASLIGQAVLFNEQVARSLGLSPTDLQAFGMVARHAGPMTASELASMAGLPASTTTRVLDRLESGGYVVRGAVEGDRRKVAVQVVPEKVAEVDGHYAQQIDQIRQLRKRWSTSEFDVVVSFLRDLAAFDPHPNGTS